MNGQRITISLIFLMLVAACLFQTTMLGCNKSTDEVEEAEVIATVEDQTGFFDRTEKTIEPIQERWEPVSDGIMNQVLEMFDSSGMLIGAIETDANNTESMRCTIEFRDGLNFQKQILDGFNMFFTTFPNQDKYRVELTDGTTQEINWDTLQELDEVGYTLESSERDAEIIWRMVIREEPERTGDAGLSIVTE